MKVLIVEDEFYTQQGLITIINSFQKDIDIVESCETVKEAVQVANEKLPDLVLLDINLPDGNAFDFLEETGELTFSIIFITAHDDFAIKAIKKGAIDYVLKPYAHDELSKAIERAKMHIQPNKERLDILKQTLKSPEKKPDKISLHTLDKIIIVNLDDIIRCESDSNNTMFYLKEDKKVFVTKTLKYFADLLKPYGFLRVHQSHLVNLQCISAFIKTDGGYLMLKNGKSVPVSVRKKSEVIEVLDQMHK